MFVRLVSTMPRYGGFRIWFECPRQSCRRRCRVLLRPARTNARAYACRRCAGVDYATQRMSGPDRIRYRADKLLHKLERTGELTWKRPRGMHERIYERIIRAVEALDALTQVRLAEISHQIGRRWPDYAEVDSRMGAP